MTYYYIFALYENYCIKSKLRFCFNSKSSLFCVFLFSSFFFLPPEFRVFCLFFFFFIKCDHSQFQYFLFRLIVLKIPPHSMWSAWSSPFPIYTMYVPFLETLIINPLYMQHRKSVYIEISLLHMLMTILRLSCQTPFI